jgi:hypothetical protein
MFLVINQVGLTFWYLAGLALLALRHRLPTPLLIVVWLLLPFLYLQFGSTSLTPYVPLPKQPRYLGVIAAPAVILIAGWLARWRVSSVPWSRRAVLALLILYAASSLVLLAVTHADRQMVTKPVRDTARYLDENDLYALHATSLFANTIPLLSSRAEGSRVGRVCVGCSAGPCTTPHPGLLGEVWAIPSGYHGSPAPAVTECGRWRRLSTLEVSPSGAYRRALTVAVAIADRLPYVRESVRRILEPRSVVVHVPLESAQ